MKRIICALLVFCLLAQPLLARSPYSRVEKAMQADLALLEAAPRAASLLKMVGGRSTCRTECTDYIYNKNSCTTICDDDSSTDSNNYSGGGGTPNVGALLIGLLLMGIIFYFVNQAAEESFNQYSMRD